MISQSDPQPQTMPSSMRFTQLATYHCCTTAPATSIQTQGNHSTATMVDFARDNKTIDPTFDAAGNMLTGPRADDPTTEQNYIYDAWNRLVEVQDDLDATVAIMEYDGRNFRIEKTAGGVDIAFYHNESQQLLETRIDGDVDPREQFIHDLRYIDSLIVRFFDGNTDGTLDNTLYYMSDSNFNITGLVDATTGNVVERYHYDPYGKFQVYDGSWNTLTSTAYANDYFFTGRRFEADLLIYYYRARFYAFDLGRFIHRDPIGYGDGYNVYQYVGGSPMNALDPSGQHTIIGQLKPTLKSKFEQWYRKEKADGAWWTELPKCPCSIAFSDEARTKPVSPDDKVWLTPKPKKDFPATFGGAKLFYVGKGFFGLTPGVTGFTNPPDLHPDAVWDMRQKERTGKYGNQCTYDAKGKLITSGLGAGTVDKRYYGKVDYDTWNPMEMAKQYLKKSTDQIGHLYHDVTPFWAAWLLDGKAYGANVAKYLEVRPTHNEAGCDMNEVGGKCET